MCFLPIRRRIVQRLTSIFAGALQCKTPDLSGMSWKERLESFGRFTRERTDSWIRSGKSEPDLHSRLFESAGLLGKEIRTRFRIRSFEDVLRMGRILYRTIGIDFRGMEDGRIFIRRCFFSVIYSEATCRVVSAFDKGFLYGLSGGMHLQFSRRITEGASCCEARLAGEGP